MPAIRRAVHHPPAPAVFSKSFGKVTGAAIGHTHTHTLAQVIDARREPRNWDPVIVSLPF